MPKPKDKPPSKPPSSVPKLPITTDSRFTSIHTDARFAPPRRKDAKLTIDKRFARMLDDDDFSQKASVDRYGRRIGKGKGKEEIMRYYNLEDEDEEVVRGRVYDPARGEGVISTSEESEESSSDDGQVAEEEGEVAEYGGGGDGGDEVPVGKVTRRFAVVNLDWDHVRAVDLFKTFSSFVRGGGKVDCVAVYASEFGRGRMEREEVEGPPVGIFRSRGGGGADADADEESDVDVDADEEDEITEKTIVKEDKGEEFDSGKLRNYQLERLRYYYAVVECDSPSTAKYIYDQCDGAEYEATANFFDLRFIPNDTSFEDDKPREKCTEVPASYRPNGFTTDALQHSKVKLTWDEDDPQRKLAAKRAFSQQDLEDMDLKAYLASSDSEYQSETAARAAAKDKYRALLSATGFGKKDEGGVVGNMEVTFTSGLSENKGGKVIVEGGEHPGEEEEENTIAKYARKEKERRQRRKEKMRAARETGPTKGRPEQKVVTSKEAAATDLGFDDPFFSDDHDATASKEQEKKEKKRKGKEVKAKEVAEAESKRAELELLMMDEDERVREDGTKLRHFDMKQIIKAENKKKKSEKRGRADEKDPEGIQDDFEMDVRDPRFAAVYENHEFAIDPTNPRFVKTKAMNKLLEERRNRTQRDEHDPTEEGRDARDRKRKKQKVEENTGGGGGSSKGKKDELARLVQSLKSKSAKKA